MSKQLLDKIKETITQKIADFGYNVWGCELHLQGKYSILRVYIEHPNETKNISLDDCSAVSEQISVLLDTEDFINYSYSLEVSSPGLNRPLFDPEHYRRFIGSNVHVHLSASNEGRRNFVGRIVKILDSAVVIDVEGSSVEVLIENIEKANLVVEF